MLRRVHGYLLVRSAPGPEASEQLQRDGYAMLRGVLSTDEIRELSDEISAVYDAVPADGRAPGRRDPAEDEDFRYEMFNRSALAQRAIGHPAILETIEPLLGEDCHVIANTCWRNPPRRENRHGGGFWHIDSGPHIPRDSAVPWDSRIPYPIFAIGAHIYLEDCPLECGPTGVLAGSHTSGSPPPKDRLADTSLEFNGAGVIPLTAEAGDVCLFVSDVWHRRLPSQEGDTGRFFCRRTTAGAISRSAFDPRAKSITSRRLPRHGPGPSGRKPCWGCTATFSMTADVPVLLTLPPEPLGKALGVLYRCTSR
ncbi:MAG: phytanoyl-CoA dioxygenase family protein [Gammaproteobacteria bacterium]|nr:phytanoyl-CoA dioxygenase family protein [Gammaproteobacteria bacterium]